jgi:hypothetical protein
MKRLIEYLLIILVTYSIIEFATIVLATILHSYTPYTNVEAMMNSRIVILEVMITILAAFVYNKVLVKKR